MIVAADGRPAIGYEVRGSRVVVEAVRGRKDCVGSYQRTAKEVATRIVARRVVGQLEADHPGEPVVRRVLAADDRRRSARRRRRGAPSILLDKEDGARGRRSREKRDDDRPAREPALLLCRHS